MAVAATPTNGAATFADVSTVNAVYGLIEKIGRQEFMEARASNRLSIFDKGFLPSGTALESVLVKAATSRAYVPNASSATTPVNPDVLKRYFNQWVRRDYVASVKPEDVQAILTTGAPNAQVIGDFAASILASIDNGEIAEDYTDLKALLAKFAADYARDSQKITAPADLTDLVEKIRFAASDMSFFNDTYAGVTGCTTSTRESDLVIIMPHVLVNKIDVRVFANLYNLGQANIVPQIVGIDSNDGLVYVTDKDAFGVITKYRDFGMVENRNARSRDYILGVTKMFYYNPLYKTALIDASGLLTAAGG